MKLLARLAATAVATVGLAASTSSCFAVTDLDRFETRAVNTSNFSDLRLTVRGMTSHVLELFEYRVVDANNTIQSRGFIVPLGGVEASLYVPGAVPKQNGPFNLDFYADHDNSGGYDVDPAKQGDHAWRIALSDDRLDDRGVYSVLFDHNTSFSFLSNPAPSRTVGQQATVHLKNMGALVGKRIEVRIADASSKRVVALYRIPTLGDAAVPVTITIPGMVESSVDYLIDVYTDDKVATPASIKSFRLEQVSGPTGLTVDFDPATAPVVTDVTPP